MGGGTHVDDGTASMSRWARIRLRVHLIVESADPGDRPSLIFDGFIVVLIVTTLVTLALETVPSIHARHGTLLRRI